MTLLKKKMNKKWIITLGIVLGVVVLGIAAYFAWKNREQIAEVIPGIVGGVIVPIQPSVEKLSVLSSRKVDVYWTQGLATSSTILYLDEEGSIFEIDNEGMETAAESGPRSPIDVVPSHSGNWLFAKLSQDGDSAVYDAINNIRIRDFIGIESVVWGREEGKIAMLVSGSDTGLVSPQVIIEDINAKTPAQVITKFSLLEFSLQWPQKDSIYLTQKPSADYVSDMWKVDIATKKFSKFLSDRGLMVQWSPLGDRALKFTTTEGRNHKLSVIDEKGGELMALRFVTLPDKCVMTTPTQMYCAIPRDQEALTHMTLPDDYLKRSVYFQDGIYQIDLATNGIRAIYEDEEPIIDATNLTVLEDKILFINRYDRKLYSLSLQ